MVKTNIMPIFITDMKILLKLCSFLRFFDVFQQKIGAVKKSTPGDCFRLIIFQEADLPYLLLSLT